MIISSSAAQRHCSKVLQMPQLQNHRAQATMRLQFQQQQPPVTRLLHPRLHRTAAACLLKIMIKFKIKFEIIFVKLKLKSFRIQETTGNDTAASGYANTSTLPIPSNPPVSSANPTPPRHLEPPPMPSPPAPATTSNPTASPSPPQDSSSLIVALIWSTKP